MSQIPPIGNRFLIYETVVKEENVPKDYDSLLCEMLNNASVREALDVMACTNSTTSLKNTAAQNLLDKASEAVADSEESAHFYAKLIYDLQNAHYNAIGASADGYRYSEASSPRPPPPPYPPLRLPTLRVPQGPRETYQKGIL